MTRSPELSVDSAPIRSRTGLPAWWVRAVVAGIGLGAGLLMASQTYWSMLDHGHSWWTLFAWKFACWIPWIVAAPWILRAGARLHGESRWKRFLPHVPASFALALAQLTFAGLIAFWLQPYYPVATEGFSRYFERHINPWLYLDFILYGMLLVIGYGLAAYRRARRMELRESQLETELAKAQLEALRLEIRPHFLFNTLNSIAALVRREANGRALEMLLGLSELLRATLEGADRQLVPLATELDLVKRYVDLQQARFGDRLEVRFEVEDDALDLMVPTLILQPLVENAFRHGFSRRAEAGSIEIAASREGERLHLQVTDDGAGLPPTFSLRRDAGVGLRNSTSRLEQLYGDEAEIVLTPGGEAGTVAEIWLPAQRHEAPSSLEAAAG